VTKSAADHSRTAIRGVGWKKRTTIATEKYDLVSGAILDVLTAQPITFAELVARVTRRLPRFEGSLSWYTITCARELEVRGRIKRSGRPVLYSKPAKRSGQR
jgi:Family of unknown function (DUF6958)